MSIEENLRLLDGVETAVLDLDAGGVYFTVRRGKFPSVDEIRRVVEDSGFELGDVQIALRARVAGGESSKRIIPLDFGVVFRDPGKVLARASEMLRAGTHVVVRGRLASVTKGGVTLNACGYDLLGARQGLTPEEVILPLCD